MAGTAPPLPDVFDGYSPPFEVAPQSSRRVLVVVAGVPGTGKSSIAEEIGRRLGVPTFSFDWLMGAITQKFPAPVESAQLSAMGFELLVTLALRQLAVGQSAVLDVTAEDALSRDRLESLARRFGAELKVVECICSDVEVHRARVEGRARWIPGWSQTVRWDEHVAGRRAAYEHWAGDTVVLDAVDDLDANIDAAVRFVADERSGPSDAG